MWERFVFRSFVVTKEYHRIPRISRCRIIKKQTEKLEILPIDRESSGWYTNIVEQPEGLLFCWEKIPRDRSPGVPLTHPFQVVEAVVKTVHKNSAGVTVTG